MRAGFATASLVTLGATAGLYACAPETYDRDSWVLECRRADRVVLRERVIEYKIDDGYFVAETPDKRLLAVRADICSISDAEPITFRFVKEGSDHES